jgi:thiol:disulfide interchange protein DsbA
MLKQFAAGLTLIFIAMLAQAQPKPGTDYLELSPAQSTDSPGRIEVVEFFWYGCPHCFNLEPVLEPWIKKLPKDVQFHRIPAMFNDEYAQSARAFYALDAIGEEQRVHKALFEAIHVSGLRVGNEAAITEWLGKQGVDTKKFAAAYRSFGVESKLNRAAQLTRAYKLDGVPTMAVNGRFVISASAANSRERLLEVTDYLIDRARKDGVRTAPKK